MAWQTTLVTMVRNLIGDLSATPTYSDAQIQESITVAAYMVYAEYPFSVQYTFDLDTPDITPDPTVSDPIDYAAVALFPLKAACMLNLNSMQTSVGNSIRVKDGTSEIDTSDGFKGWESILKNGPCQAYDKLLKQLQYNGVRGVGGTVASFRAVVTPINITGFYNDTGCVSRFYNSFCG